MELDCFKDKLISFIKERDWDQFHSPKNLAMNLSIEANEVLEHFLWKKEDDDLGDKLDAVKDEIGDVFITLIALSDKLGLDLLEAAEQKLLKIGENYPVDKVKGKCLKYSEYEIGN